MSTPSLARLLTEGGDERLDIDPSTGLNMYGCAATPRPAEISFCSSTASTISHTSYAALQADWARIQADMARDGDSATYRRELDRIRCDFRTAMGLSEVDMVMAASGTDIHLLAALLFSNLDGRRLVTLTLTGSETGSAVPTAAAGNNFMTRPPGGKAAEKGSPIDLGDDIRNLTFTARDADGLLRDADEVEAELTAHILEAQARGERCLLIVADVSKTGLIAPGLETVFRLRTQFADCLDILIDACQLRLAPMTLQAYLAQNLLVAVTGSKFLAGPVFSGALLVPPKQAKRLRRRRMPTALGNYCSRWDWPNGWTAQGSLPDRANFGLVLRWQAALYGLMALSAKPQAAVRMATQVVADAVIGRIENNPLFATVDSRPLDRTPLPGLAADTDFDSLPTIFPFCLRHGNGDMLTTAETVELYRAVARDSADHGGVRLGQPVAIGGGISALRLCLSAPMLAAACQSDEALTDLIDAATNALDRVAFVTASMRRDGQTRGAA